MQPEIGRHYWLRYRPRREGWGLGKPAGPDEWAIGLRAERGEPGFMHGRRCGWFTTKHNDFIEDDAVLFWEGPLAEPNAAWGGIESDALEAG